MFSRMSTFNPIPQTTSNRIMVVCDVEHNPYASPIGDETNTERPLGRLGLASFLLSVVATMFLIWVATRINADRSQTRIPIITWHWPGRTALLIVASFAWLLSASGFTVGGCTFHKPLKQAWWGKAFGWAGFILAIFNLFMSLMYWAHLTED